jgi:hypothetical protein
LTARKICSRFVLIVAVIQPLLSAQPPEVPQRAGLGDRFHYFRGHSGRRYLFSVVPPDTLGDFRAAVVITARRTVGGRLAAEEIVMLDVFGRPAVRERRRVWAPPGSDTVILVHLLAETEGERRDLIADLSPATTAPLNLAA